MQSGLLALAAVALLLAGCAHPQAQATSSSPAPATTTAARATTAPPATTTAPSTSAAPARMAIHGVVVDEALHPLGATVTILETNASQATGAGGAFRFDDLRPDVYFLTARSTGFRAQTLSVTPEAAQQPLRFQLAANPSDAPYNTTIHFRGRVECALEALIISPSCDSVITDPKALGHPELGRFNTTNSVVVDVEDGWRTVVGTLVFDPSGQPGLDGLRVTVQGTHNQSALGTYQQYGRFDGQDSFAFRLEPGATYADTTAGPVPQNTTAFKFEVYPQSHLWHVVCVPPGEGGTCFLGLGAGLDVGFDLYVTTFYGQPAPDGFRFG
ncbi:MAG: CarboxypepD reg-like domain [Thermoplasmata archaeon]|nr:CarboxypepD reg-like domain [Thermoplasmata archaeon]